ncbi:MAG: 16S rRNA (cytosine(1402)-N(4))-methyltransferase RsmH [Acidimicrobiia bacterium]
MAGTIAERFEHRPVMVDEVVERLRPVPPGVVLDATVGGGGHARALLTALPGHRLLGLDQDGDALEAAAAALADVSDRVTLRRARFDVLDDRLEEMGVDRIAAALFDLGVSSPQFDRPERGFSYRLDAPLDMRMDTRNPLTAADVVNTYPPEELARVFRRYGDERYAHRIAALIAGSRPVSSTVELAELVRDAIPAPARRRGGHPARRVFQALRIEVNDELDVLGPALDAAIDRLEVAGRCVVLAYHSGEDRIVKERFEQAVTGGCRCPPGLPCRCGAVRRARELRPRKQRPSAAEVAANPRASSAVLRGVEKIEEVA